MKGLSILCREGFMCKMKWFMMLIIWFAIMIPCLINPPRSEGQPAFRGVDRKSRIKGEDAATSFTITSPAIAREKPIAKKYTGEGADVSPPLEWKNAPKGTKEFALICDDPDAPMAEPWLHWVIYGIPASVTNLPEGKPGKSLSSGSPGIREGKNSWGRTNYGGPLPPKGLGPHRYFFRIYALDMKLNLPAGADKKQVLFAIKGHILGKAELMGTYER